MRQKYEVEAVAKGEELEMTKMKLTARNTEAEATIDNLNARLAQVEKAKSKIQGEINEITANIDQAQVINAAMKRKAETFDTTNTEMKGKVDRLSFDLDVLSNLKRKQGDAVLEMTEQIDALQKLKAKIDKETAVIMAEIADARAATEEVVRAQVSQDKSNKALLDQLNATTWLEQSRMEIVLHFLGPGHLLDHLRVVWLEWGARQQM